MKQPCRNCKYKSKF